MEPTDINETIEEREKTHGDFAEFSSLYNLLRDEVNTCQNWVLLNSAERVAIEMILFKIARIMTGNPHFSDHYHDIAGYATLVEKLLTSDT